MRNESGITLIGLIFIIIILVIISGTSICLIFASKSRIGEVSQSNSDDANQINLTENTVQSNTVTESDEENVTNEIYESLVSSEEKEDINTYLSYFAVFNNNEEYKDNLKLEIASFFASYTIDENNRYIL